MNKYLVAIGASLAGTGVANYWLGKRGWEWLQDTAVYGSAISVPVSVAVHLFSDAGKPPALARPNGKSEGFGKVGPKAIEACSKVGSTVMQEGKLKGFKIGPAPQNTAIVVQAP